MPVQRLFFHHEIITEMILRARASRYFSLPGLLISVPTHLQMQIRSKAGELQYYLAVNWRCFSCSNSY